jgi:hypothetical protein
MKAKKNLLLKNILTIAILAQNKQIIFLALRNYIIQNKKNIM